MLKADVVGRVVRTRQNSQRLILAAGMVRSGSTWLYNAVRLVLARATLGVYGCWIDDFNREEANAAPNVLIKLHAMDEDMARRADVVFTCHRDLRDVALSIRDIGWTDDREKILEYVSYARACHEFWSGRAALDLRYESIVRTPLNVLRHIAAKLDADLSDEALEAVITDLDAIVPQPSSKGYDPVNLIHHHHQVDGTPGRWHGKIDDAMRQEIEDTHTIWLRRFGYLP